MTPSGTRSRPRPATSGPPDLPRRGPPPSCRDHRPDLLAGPAAPLRPVGAVRLVADRGPGRPGRGRDAVRHRGLADVGAVGGSGADRLLGGPDAGCQGLGGTPHRRGVRTCGRVRRAAQQPRLPPADLQPAGRHPRGDHDPRLRVGRHPAGLPRPRRPHLLRRHQRRRPPPAAAVRGHDPPRDRPRRLRAPGRPGGPPRLLRPDPSRQGDRGRDRGGRACGTAPGDRRDRARPGLLRRLRRPARRR